MARLTDTISTTVFASRPTSAGNGGRLNLQSDAYSLSRDSGAAWQNWGPLHPFTTPTDPGTWVNQGSSTIALSKDALTLTGAATGSGANLVARVAASGGAPWTKTFFLRATALQKSFNGFGVCFRESSSSKIVVFDYLYVTSGAANDPGVLRVSKYTNATTFSADYQVVGYLPPANGFWMQIKDDNTNRICNLSMDGQNWIQIHSVARADFFTTAADQYGIVISSENSSTPNFAPVLQVLSLA